MLKLGKLTDYGIVLLTHCAEAPGEAHTARALAQASTIPLPTVSKVLKQLARAEILVSLRGQSGGYRLARPAERITIADVIAALEGPIALTECSQETPVSCDIESACPVRANWQRINRAVKSSLEQLTLAQMQRPRRGHEAEPPLVQITRSAP